MCVEAMDTRSKRTKSNCLRRTVMKSASPLKWGLLRVSAKEDEALRPCRAAAAVKVTIQKCLRRQQKRAQLAELAKALGDIRQKEKMKNGEERPQRQSPGAMAPENTTQYLMSNLYEDMSEPEHNLQTLPVSHGTTSQLYGESLSPGSVYSVLDSVYESSLAFQQRDFEEVFDLCW